MEIAITKLAVICFFVVGVSHIVRPRVWVTFFEEMRRKGETGSFLNALLHFPLGVLIVSFHNVWHGLPIVLTLIGWGLVLKSFFYFVFPRHGAKMLQRVSADKSWESVVAGMFSLAISAVLLFTLRNR